MADFSDVFAVQGTLFALMFMGLIVRKCNLVDDTFQKGLTALVINVVLPCNIIMSFYVEFNMEVLMQTAQILIVSTVMQVACCLLALWHYGKEKSSRRPVLQYAILCSNAGLLGNPVAEGMFGSQGLLLTSIYLIPQRIAMWSVGVAFFATASGGQAWWKKLLRHPCIIAVELGMVLMLSQWQLPAVVESVLTNMGGCTMAMSMVLVGLLFSDFQWKSLLDSHIWKYCLVRLVLIPLVVYGACLACHVATLPMQVAVILAAMPAGATTVIMASNEGGDVDFAVGCVTVSTLLSMMAIPIWCLIIG